MKKIYTFASLLLMGVSAIAQTSFFTPTTYRGAFAPAPTTMWTDGWTNWDPQNAAYPAPTVTVTTNITTNTTWTSNNVYLIQGQIYVKNGAILTIQAGTIIQGDAASVGAGLFITKGSKIMAIGTANNPIVFTSSQPVGSRNIGDWGGIILMGSASNNSPGGVANIEGIAPTPDTQYGGGATPNDNDNSGTLSYVRIEFGGYVYAPNKEINGLTLGAVGAGTTIDHVQCSFINDDAFEWFGGTVNCKYLVAYRCLDDNWDTDNGFSGHVQFCLGVRDPNIADNPSVSTSEGFESDNDATGSTTTPLTAAVFSNVTDIGPLRGNTGTTVAAGFRRGARIRRNSNLKIFNSIFMDHLRGIHIDGTACETNATAGALKFMHNIVAGNLSGKVCETNTGSTFNIKNWFATGMNDSLVNTIGILTTPYNFLAPDYRPDVSSIALTGADFTNPFLVGIKTTNTITSNIQLYPNPTDNATTLSFELTENTNVSIVISDIMGKTINTVVNNQLMKQGENALTVETTNLTNGIYFIVIAGKTQTQTLKLVVSK